MKKSKIFSTVLKVILSLAVIFVLFWLQLPALNIRSVEFWSFVTEAIIVFTVINAFGYIWSFLKRIKFNESKQGVYIEGSEEHKRFSIKTLGKPIIIALIAVVAIWGIGIVMDVVGSEFFNAGSYNKLLELKDGDFTEDVAEISMKQIPVVDKDSAQNLGKRKLGEISDYVSQFEIADNYTQINYKNQPNRVTPLAYADIIKWFNNQSEGIPAYIKVNMTTQKTELVELEKGSYMKYSESEYFMRNIYRHLRFSYPTKIFDDVTFEIDENGVPYWVASTVNFRIGFWSGRDIEGAVLVNAITGESDYYKLDEVPSWVDQVFSSSMIVEQLEYNGKYRDGFWNSIFGQKGVLQPTEGYNYLAIDDDVWLYTGMTSVVSDESNVGFVLVNLRTKQAKFYEVPGAKEYSAMSSAEGAVQEKAYEATFPILLNIAERPTYFMSLKDEAGLVKMYAFVDVQAYQVLGTGSSVDNAMENYIANLKRENIKVNEQEEVDNVQSVEAEITDISSAVVSGNTKYYIKLKLPATSSLYVDGALSLDISLSSDLPFAKQGDKAEITYTFNEKNELVVKNFKLK